MPDKRAAYDRYGHAGCGRGGAAGGIPFQAASTIGDIFGDLFGEMFNVGGGAQRGSRQQRGDDLRFDLAIDFEDAIFGAETEVKIRRLETCPTCSGRGSASGRADRLRPVPGARTDPLSAGLLLRGAYLRRCGGTGSIIGDPCRRAAARRASKKLKAQREGSSGRRRRHAHPLCRRRRRRTPDGPRAISTWCFSIRPHDFFERNGQDLHCVVPISFPQAALGAEIEIPGIDGPVNIKIPEGTQSGKELRVRGRGVPFLNEKGMATW